MRSCNNNSNNNSSISGAGIIKCFNFCVQATAHTWPRPKRLSGFLSFGAFFRSQVWQHFNPRGVTRNGYGCARVLPSWRLHLRGDRRFSLGWLLLSQSWKRKTRAHVVSPSSWCTLVQYRVYARQYKLMTMMFFCLDYPLGVKLTNSSVCHSRLTDDDDTL